MNTNLPRQYQYGIPLHIDQLDAGGTALRVERIRLDRKGEDATKHDEGWLQRLIFSFPQALPIAEIDPGLGTLVPICLELPSRSGYADNLYLTEDGDIVIAECKLWRNPEARREVVAQIIDYAHAMASWSYADLEAAVRKGTRPNDQTAEMSLYQRVSAESSIDEQHFVDAVSRNLRLGRLVLVVVGDGIREGAETLSEYLQLHAGFHFTLALVEMPVYRLPAGGFVLTPRLLARTVNIERGIVRVVDGKAVIEQVPQAERVQAARTTLTQDRMIESLETLAPGFTPTLHAFAAAGEEHGITLQPAAKSLMVRFLAPDESVITAGGFGHDGSFVTYTVCWRPAALGLVDLAHEYLERLAALLGGSVRKTPTPSNWYVIAKDGKPPSAMDVLTRYDAWIPLIVDFERRLRDAMDQREL